MTSFQPATESQTGHIGEKMAAALKERGLIKVGNFLRSDNKLAYIYLLTPKGVADKLAITKRFLTRKRKEFELLKFLTQHPGRVFSREQLLSEVWGYDYFGGTRTVDVHVRRLRAKLGEHESLIGTVRNVGYRLNPDGSEEE